MTSRSGRHPSKESINQVAAPRRPLTPRSHLPLPSEPLTSSPAAWRLGSLFPSSHLDSDTLTDGGGEEDLDPFQSGLDISDGSDSPGPFPATHKFFLFLRISTAL